MNITDAEPFPWRLSFGHTVLELYTILLFFLARAGHTPHKIPQFAVSPSSTLCSINQDNTSLKIKKPRLRENDMQPFAMWNGTYKRRVCQAAAWRTSVSVLWKATSSQLSSETEEEEEERGCYRESHVVLRLRHLLGRLAAAMEYGLLCTVPSPSEIGLKPILGRPIYRKTGSGEILSSVSQVIKPSRKRNFIHLLIVRIVFILVV